MKLQRIYCLIELVSRNTFDVSLIIFFSIQLSEKFLTYPFYTASEKKKLIMCSTLFQFLQLRCLTFQTHRIPHNITLLEMPEHYSPCSFLPTGIIILTYLTVSDFIYLHRVRNIPSV